ncbi:hypothetical protein JHK85_043747 [Glycine max]|nr:hypothetical protein JHK85_043747 [Glycine max]
MDGVGSLASEARLGQWMLKPIALGPGKLGLASKFWFTQPEKEGSANHALS